MRSKSSNGQKQKSNGDVLLGDGWAGLFSYYFVVTIYYDILLYTFKLYK